MVRKVFITSVLLVALATAAPTSVSSKYTCRVSKTISTVNNGEAVNVAQTEAKVAYDEKLRARTVPGVTTDEAAMIAYDESAKLSYDEKLRARSEGTVTYDESAKVAYDETTVCKSSPAKLSRGNY